MDLISRDKALMCATGCFPVDSERADECKTIAKRLSDCPSAFEGMINREIISEFVERDDSFAIMVDEVNGTVNIELSLDFWNSPYQKGGM